MCIQIREGFFSIFKRGMRGNYQRCKEEHLHRHRFLMFYLKLTFWCDCFLCYSTKKGAYDHSTENLVMKSLILLALTAAIALCTVVTSQAGPRYPQDHTWNYADQGGNGGGAGGGGGD
jgi:hypothetical protein